MEIKKLSDTGPLKAFFLPTTKLNDYIFTPTRVEIDVNKSYDTALVLGCSDHSIMKYRADVAVKLYKKGIINKILVTGGSGLVGRNPERSEAYVMRNHMIANGVRGENIILEDRARNTFENMKNSVSLINPKEDIVLVTSHFHQRRSKAVLESMNPELKVLSYGVLDGKHDISKWQDESLIAKRLIRTEALLLSYYVQRGLVNDQIATLANYEYSVFPDIDDNVLTRIKP